MTLDSLLAGWDGEQLVARREPVSGTLALVAIHSTRRGPAAGGTRMRPYASALDAVADVLRLAQAMTLKMAVHDVPLGGGKAVLAVPELPDDTGRERLLHDFGELVEGLGGRFSAGPDMNTSSADMDVIGERTAHVFFRSPEHGGSGDPAASTAAGVFHGIRASLAHATGTDGLAGRTVVVQGVGNVGGRLAELLAGAGARVIVCDLDAPRAAALAARLGASAIDATSALATPCDVLAPCAAGGVISEHDVATLGCRVVAGSANNPLADDRVAKPLRDAGVLYAPDYVINGGGVLHGAGLELLGWDGTTLRRRLEGIGETLRTLYREADSAGTTPLAAAEALARSRLSVER